MNKNINEERAKRLGKEPVIDLLFRFSLPAIIGMLVQALYNIVDRIFIGRGVGELAIGALYLAMPFMLIILAFSLLVGIGGNTLVSIKLGQKRTDEANQIASNSLTLLFIIGIVLSGFGLILIEPLLKLFGASPLNIGYATDYLKIIFLGATFNILGIGMNNFIRGEGNPKIAMFTMFIGAFTNIILDYVFIFIFNMGVKGAAIATVISQFLSASWVLYYFFSKKSVLSIQRKYLKLKASLVKKILANGFASFSMQIAASIVSAFLNTQLQIYGGALAISSMSIIHSFKELLTMIVVGINQGSQPIIGFNHGAGQYDRVKKTVLYASLVATLITTLGFVMAIFFPTQIVELFMGKDGNKELLDIAVPGIRIFLAMFFIVGYQIVSTGYFQATGKPRYAFFLSIARQLLFLVPSMLIFSKFFGLTGVWLSSPFSDLLSAVIATIFLIKSLKKLK